ncbi:MAG: PIG-L family deacetylase [Acidobacteria bacterium]|nr:PIG-L family deacetylase [Acidobacteriota bacterium]
MRLRVLLGGFLLLLAAPGPSPGQRRLAGMPAIRSSLDRLQTTASVLLIGAHPDDENTALLAYFARGRKVRAAYLSLTRGEGGQNLIGSEQGDLLGIIRTQELLAARRIDGAEQFFTRAIDFGFSKTAEETLAKWGRRETLGDIVWVIRSYRPDVVILRFSGTPRDGHGHHQASAMLGKEAFSAAADPKQFPEQLRWAGPWQARRLLWNVFGAGDQRAPGSVSIDTGSFDPILGYSFGEIAGMSRSMHRSQGFGAAERRGSQLNSLVHVAGEPAASDTFDGIDTTWNRVPGGAAVAAPLSKASREFRPEQPEAIVPLLLEARAALGKIKDPRVGYQRSELDETIALCAGLWLDAAAANHFAAPGAPLSIEISALNRSRLPLALTGVSFRSEAEAPPAADFAGAALEYNRPVQRTLVWNVPAAQPYSQPFWLRTPRNGDRYKLDDPRLAGRADTIPALEAQFRLRLGSQEFEVTRPVVRRYVDRVYGEQTRPLAIGPPVSVKVAQTALLFPSAQPRRVEVGVQSNVASAAGQLRLALGPGWRATPAERAFALTPAGDEIALEFEVTPPAGEARGELRAVASIAGREEARSMDVLQYEHIPIQTVFPPSATVAVGADVRTLARTVGYVAGAGDEIPEALRQLGCEVILLADKDLAAGDLDRFDAIVTGVRAFNTRAALRASVQRLFDYASRGGTLVVQYNVLEGGFLAGDPRALDRLGPYPLRVGRDRVTVEQAPVTLVNPAHPLLRTPNRIAARDFEGWVQERGLYFASEWDPRYEPLFEMNDPGEKPSRGATLVAKYGKGAYVFTAISWFRQLPAGVPGAYRIFANLLSAAKSLP